MFCTQGASLSIWLDGVFVSFQAPTLSPYPLGASLLVTQVFSYLLNF